MLALTPILLLLPAVLGGIVPSTLRARDVSPDNTCGTTGAGEDKGYTCLEEAACCSQYGYCGTGDQFCLTTAGCQAEFSNSSSACTEPVPGKSISVDGTCGTTDAGSVGYVCPSNQTSCCSASGYCGDSAEHCGEGCQSDYGKCGAADEASGDGTSSSRRWLRPVKIAA